MRLRPRGGGGWLWPAVLVASAVLVAVSGHHLIDSRSLASDIPVVTRVEDAPPVRSSPAPVTEPTDTQVTGWRTRSAAPARARTVSAPKRLVAASVGLDLRVEPRGVDDDGQMALPADPGRLGWYRFGAAPSDREGSVVLAGHVDSRTYGAGPLERAAGLHKGDDLRVTDAKGRVVTYRVVAVQRINKSDFDGGDIFARSGRPVLRLITCGGPYLPRRGGYQDNLVMTAERR